MMSRTISSHSTPLGADILLDRGGPECSTSVSDLTIDLRTDENNQINYNLTVDILPVTLNST